MTPRRRNCRPRGWIAFSCFGCLLSGLRRERSHRRSCERTRPSTARRTQDAPGTYTSKRTWRRKTRPRCSSNGACTPTYFDHDHNLAAVVFPRVDDFIIARKEQCPEYKFRDYLVKTLHLERTDGDVWTYCGKTITVTPSAYLVSNQKAIMSLEDIAIDRSRRAHDDEPVIEEERTAYRSAIGSLNYLTLWTRGDLQAAVSLAAQMTTRAAVGDLKTVNKIIGEARKTRDLQLTFRRATCEVAKATIVAWGDSAFANSARKANAELSSA